MRGAEKRRQGILSCGQQARASGRACWVNQPWECGCMCSVSTQAKHSSTEQMTDAILLLRACFGTCMVVCHAPHAAKEQCKSQVT
jgi:hypothetical protein